jgi:hypothetical protein
MNSRNNALAVGLAFVLVATVAEAGGGKSSTPNAVGAQASQNGKGPSAARVSPVTPRVAAPSAVRAETKDELTYGSAIHYENLSLVPVMTTKTGPFQKYTLLEAGLEAKTLEVREIGGAPEGAERAGIRRGRHRANFGGDLAQVNAVEVRNSGNYPVYLLGGEMILGGKQDRIIQSDTVVPNSRTWTRVAVFCVEHGRWSGQNMKFAAGKALAHVALREAALSGQQGKVWAEVAAKNKKHNTTSSTDTYRRTIQNDKVRAKIAPYRERIVKMLPGGDKRVAGLIFAINGKIRVADLFGNPVLFGDVRDKVLSAYILEALGQQVVRDAAPMTVNAAKGFIAKGRSGKRVLLQKQGRSKSYKFDYDASNPMVGGETVDEGNGQKVRETYIGK